MIRMFTYEEFYTDVEKQVLLGRSAFPSQEVKAFVKENERMIRDKYDYAAKKYAAGQCGIGNVNNGATSSVANCLILMF